MRFCCLRMEAGTIGRPEDREGQVPDLNTNAVKHGKSKLVYWLVCATWCFKTLGNIVAVE